MRRCGRTDGRRAHRGHRRAYALGRGGRRGDAPSQEAVANDGGRHAGPGELPDLSHLLSIAGWWLFGYGSFAAVRGYAVAIPGQELGMPPLVQLWSHIVIDVFAYSVDYYAVPVLDPFLCLGFGGIAWITPWFMALNYGALATVGAWLLMRRRRPHGR